mgnify:CR=1 FL=1
MGDSGLWRGQQLLADAEVTLICEDGQTRPARWALVLCGVTGASLPALPLPPDEVGAAVAAAPGVWVGPLLPPSVPPFPLLPPLSEMVNGVSLGGSRE